MCSCGHQGIVHLVSVVTKTPYKYSDWGVMWPKEGEWIVLSSKWQTIEEGTKWYVYLGDKYSIQQGQSMHYIVSMGLSSYL